MKLDNLDQRQEAYRLYQVYSDLFDLWNAGPTGEGDVLDNRSRMQAAYDAYVAYAEENDAELYTDYEGNPVMCGVSKVPLLLADELVEDTHSGEAFLRSALGLPPRPPMPDISDLDQEAA